MANKGYFVITDISGYTEFLTKSELEHAHETLQSLFDAQLERIKFPMHISGFRGDAIFMYIPENEFVNPQSLVEHLENLYIAFSDTLQQMILNTTCECNACKNIKSLDLKMAVHFGEYLIQKLGDKEELLGADVIVPHRMLKNHVIEKTGIKAYAIFSDTAAYRLNLHSLCHLTHHTETYEHLGEMQIHVHNLRTAWENYQNSRHHVVDHDSAWIKIELDIPFPPSLIWDYLTNPLLEAPILGLDSVTREDDLGGRTRPGANFHCAHASGDFFNKIVDWKPFDYYTTLQTVAGGIEYYRTIRMQSDGKVTKLGVYVSQPNQEPPGFRAFLESAARQGYERVESFIQEDIEKGKMSAG